MKRMFIPLILAVLAIGSSNLEAQVIDRMMAVVDNHIITLSDVVRERQIREVLSTQGADDDKTILNDLINAQLIDNEIIQSTNIEVTDADIDSEFARITQLRGLAPSAVRDAIGRRLRTEQFFDVRFRQAVRASDDEIQQYYKNIFVPEAQKRGVTSVPTLDQVSDVVQKNLIEEKTMHEVDVWLAATRQRSDVEIFP